MNSFFVDKLVKKFILWCNYNSRIVQKNNEEDELGPITMNAIAPRSWANYEKISILSVMKVNARMRLYRGCMHDSSQQRAIWIFTGKRVKIQGQGFPTRTRAIRRRFYDSSRGFYSGAAWIIRETIHQESQNFPTSEKKELRKKWQNANVVLVFHYFFW